MKPSFFPYLGGKFLLAKKLIPLFPEHINYIEPFGGAANVLLQKPPSHLEVYNDINGDIVNVFRQFRDNNEAFMHKVRYTPYSREIFYENKAKLETETDPLERAVAWWCVRVMSFGAMGDNFGCYRTAVHSDGSPRKRIGAYKNRIDKHFPKILDRLLWVQFENLDIMDCIDRYDNADAFFYCDPPYHPDTRKGVEYKHEMTAEDHKEFAERLKTVNGKVMVSGYQHAVYDQLGWQRHNWDVPLRATVPKNRRRTESVYMNYEPKE